MRKIIYIAIALGLSACGSKTEQAQNEKEEVNTSTIEVTKSQFATMKMEIAPIGIHDFNTSISATGKIDVTPQNKAKVTSFVDGYVKAIHLQVGEHVRKGQALVTLESPEFLELQQSYLETSSQIEYLKSEYERQHTLYKENITSQKKYLEAESNYNTTKARFNSLKQRLRQLNVNLTSIEEGKFTSTITIHAPIAGDASFVNVNIGMSVSKADELVELINSKEVLLSLTIFEKDVLNIHEGQSVIFYVPQAKDQKYKAKITKIGKSIQGNDRVVSVLAKIDQTENAQFIVGMLVDALITTTSQQYLSVAEDALINEDGEYAVLVLESESEDTYMFNICSVELGARNGDMLELVPSDDIKQGAKILMKGAYFIN